jgi:mannose-1-phosphate guanylyltransferase
MRHALIMAGGSGTRLWPMSRADRPKQLIPFLGGKSLLQLAFERLEPLVPAERRWVCAGETHAAAVRRTLPGLAAGAYLGEPAGRDTLNAVGFGAAVIARQDPDAVIAVFTADHLIEPVDAFQRIVESGMRVVERHPGTLATFGIAPTGPATGYGYLELGDALDGDARVVARFQEKPDAATARRYVDAGPTRYLWNSGMFVWRAETILDCIRRYEPEVHAGLSRIADAWGTPRSAAVLAGEYPRLRKTSVDLAVMERASRDPAVRVAAVPMPLRWLDVGSWPSFAETCERDADANAVSAGRALLMKTARTLVASDDPAHLVAVLGCEDLLVIHTRDATLVCRADQAEAIKELHRRVGDQFGPGSV